MYTLADGDTITSINTLINSITKLYNDKHSSSKYIPTAEWAYNKIIPTNIVITFPKLVGDHPDQISKTLDIEINNLKEEVYCWVKGLFDKDTEFLVSYLETRYYQELAQYPIGQQIATCLERCPLYSSEYYFNPESFIHNYIIRINSPLHNEHIINLQYSVGQFSFVNTAEEVQYLIKETTENVHKQLLQELSELLDIKEVITDYEMS